VWRMLRPSESTARNQFLDRRRVAPSSPPSPRRGSRTDAG
jgi:hypothetical protein